MKKMYYLCTLFRITRAMNKNLDILIAEATLKVAQYEGLSALFGSFASDTRKYVEALCADKEEITKLSERCTRAEEELAIERARPLNYTCNVTLPSAEEAESLYPRKGKYADTVVWLAEQKKKGVDFYAAAGMNRSKMCRQLSEIFKWEVNENSLRKAQEEADKQPK